MNFSSIALFVYNRPIHCKKMIEALVGNIGSKESEIFIFSDGPKNEKDEKLVQEVRKILNEVSGFKKINLIMRKENLGLSKSIISGISEILDKYDRVIVLEDDLITSKYFLKYMNEALEFYYTTEQVISIHGYIYPVKLQLPETFFLRGADCWGWATWRRGWDLFESDGEKLLTELKENNLLKEFDWNGSLNNVRMLKNFIKGKNDSWAIRWHASAFLKNKLTLYPGKSLVKNIGVDGLGTNVKKTKIYNTTLTSQPIEITTIPIEESIEAKNIISEYFREHQSYFNKIIQKFS